MTKIVFEGQSNYMQLKQLSEGDFFVHKGDLYEKLYKDPTTGNGRVVKIDTGCVKCFAPTTPVEKVYCEIRVSFEQKAANPDGQSFKFPDHWKVPPLSGPKLRGLFSQYDFDTSGGAKDD